MYSYMYILHLVYCMVSIRIFNLYHNMCMKKTRSHAIWTVRCVLILKYHQYNIVTNMTFPSNLWQIVYECTYTYHMHVICMSHAHKCTLINYTRPDLRSYGVLKFWTLSKFNCSLLCHFTQKDYVCSSVHC